jgi:filamentous hemagglutinin family protein
MHPRSSNLVLTTAALIALNVMPAAGGPEGGTVVGGAATIQGQGGPAVIVNQTSNSAIINWNTFNIGVKESVQFNQPGSSSVALNRVTGGLGPSEILGTLTANGRIFLINRDGILFGPSSVVNTAGFLATTHDIRNADFMAGRAPPKFLLKSISGPYCRAAAGKQLGVPALYAQHFTRHYGQSAAMQPQSVIEGPH